VANESSDPQELLLPVSDGLLKEEIPFMLVGSYSSSFYGIPRSTKDADIVVELGSKSLVGLDAIWMQGSSSIDRFRSRG
jgi:hypothetical protein